MSFDRTLLLDNETVQKLITMKEAIAAVEKAFQCLGEGKTQMPAKVYLTPANCPGDFRAMPASVECFRGCTVKWVNVHPGNRAYHLPTVMALVILSDPRNGFPLCVMSGTYATAIRTAAAGAVAAKYLAKPNPETVALVGCGVQAKHQLLALTEQFSLRQVRVWGLPGEAVTFIRQPEFQELNLTASETIQSCVAGADIVVTTTPAREPLVKLEWLAPQAHINAIGADAPGKQELDPRILETAKVVVDSWEQASHSGEINVPVSQGLLKADDIYADIGQIVAGIKSGRSVDTGITVFDSTGLGIQDTAVANVIYENALKLPDVPAMRFD